MTLLPSSFYSEGCYGICLQAKQDVWFACVVSGLVLTSPLVWVGAPPSVYLYFLLVSFLYSTNYPHKSVTASKGV